MAQPKSNGTTVTVGGTAIGGLLTNNRTGGSVNTIKTTVRGLTHDTFVGGIVDSGTFDMTGKFDITDTGQLALIAGEGDTAAFVVTYDDPGDTTETFSAIIGTFDTEAGEDDTVNFSISCKITGAVTIAA